MKKFITAVLLAMLMLFLAAPVGARLETAVEGAEVTVADIEWRFVPAGDGGYHVQSAANGKYLGRSGDAIAMVDAPVSWVYEVRSEDDLNNYALYSPELGAPLRFSPNMSRYSLRTPFTYIGLFEKNEAEGGGGTRYLKVTEVKDNAVYIIMGMVSDDGVPKALTNFLETQDGSNMGGAAVDIINDEYITFDAPAPEPEPEPAPVPATDPDNAEEPADNNNNNENNNDENENIDDAADGKSEGDKSDGNDGMIIWIGIAAAAALLVVIIVVLAGKKNKK